MSKHDLRAETGGSRLNRMILLLNVGVLVVNFFLVFQAMDSQIGLMRSTANAENLSMRRAGRGALTNSALPSARVLQSLESAAGADSDAFAPQKLRAVHDAVRGYQRTMGQGVMDLLLRPEEDEDLRQLYAQLSKTARDEVEIALARGFSDPALVRRLTTEVIRACQ